MNAATDLGGLGKALDLLNQARRPALSGELLGVSLGVLLDVLLGVSLSVCPGEYYCNWVGQPQSLRQVRALRSLKSPCVQGFCTWHVRLVEEQDADLAVDIQWEREVRLYVRG